MPKQDGFSIPLFIVSLASLLLILGWAIAQINAANLSAWAKVDSSRARTLFNQSAPFDFLMLRQAIDAQVDIARRGPESDAVIKAHLARLQSDPANGRNWSRYAVDLQRYGELGAALEMATSRTLELAPNSREIALEQTIIAAYNWQHVSERQHAIWESAFATALKQPKELARMAAQSGVTAALCQILRAPHALQDWCLRFPVYQRACSSSTLAPKQRQWCLSLGL